MRRTRFTHRRRAVAALALMVGVGTAIAATGNGSLKQEAARITDRATFEAAVAKSLGTTTAKLRAAIKAAATARIDAALAADEITSAEADDAEGRARRRQLPAVRSPRRQASPRSSARPRRSSTPPTATRRRRRRRLGSTRR